MTRPPFLRRPSLLLLALAGILAALATATGAQAANVIVGSPMTGSFTPFPIGTLSTFFNSKLPAGSVSSPVDGVIVGWHVVDANGGPYYLRLLTPVGGEYTVEGKSGPATPLSTGIERFATHLPIKVGQTVAVEGTASTDELGIQMDGGEIGLFSPPPAEGATVAPTLSLPAELGFNAEVQPVPTIDSLGTTSGPTAGGTFVTITGDDFTEVEGVSFGSSSAPYTVDSETQITAVAPPAAAGAVSITVTTDAGIGTAPRQFTYTGPTPTPDAGGTAGADHRAGADLQSAEAGGEEAEDSEESRAESSLQGRAGEQEEGRQIGGRQGRQAVAEGRCGQGRGNEGQGQAPIGTSRGGLPAS